MSSCWALMPVWLHIDSLFLAQHLQQMRELAEGYEGSIRKACCSMPMDRTAIMEAIGDEVEAVDASLSVLMVSGYSSAVLHQPAACGSKVSKLGFECELCG